MRFVVAALATLTVTLGALVSPASSAQGASAADFGPGYIIADSQFYAPGAMTAPQVQEFLDYQGRNCTPGTAPCLKDYTETTHDWPAESSLCSGYTGQSNERASDIIARVAQSCGISPKVLLVLLEKENTLVTRTRPATSNYQTATGFGCPDTATCNTLYYGFFNQVYRAARQYQLYALHPTWYGYQAGRSNFVPYNPNAACGGTNVYIQNQATAGLYIYTPYQPNAAALANLYGTGDDCSSYGNRNFWRLWSDWFGSPTTGTPFVIAADSPNIYMVTRGSRYHVQDWNSLLAYQAHPNVAWVGSNYLARQTDAGDVSRWIRDPSTGEIFFVDGGVKYHVPTCALMADYGSWCGAARDVDSSILTMLPRGPELTAGYIASDGHRYYVQGGSRREVFDTDSLKAAGLSTEAISGAISGISALPVGQPIVRDGVVLTSAAQNYVLADGTLHPVAAGLVSQTRLALLDRGVMLQSSLDQLPAGPPVGPVVARDGVDYVLVGDGIRPVPQALFGLPPTTLPPSLFSLMPTLPAIPGTALVATPSSPQIYEVTATVKRHILSLATLSSLSRKLLTDVVTVPDAALSSTTDGPPVVEEGNYVQAAGSPDVFLSVSDQKRVYVDSLAVMQQIGPVRVAALDSANLNELPLAPKTLSTAMTCDGIPYAGVAGRLVPRQVTVPDAPALPVTALTMAACQALGAGAGAPVGGPVFVKSPTSDAVYALDVGRHHILSWETLLRLNGGGAHPLVLVIGDTAMSQIPLASPIP